ncbi:MAG TPA: ABC-F family ATP-binding cassette domain-containing protein [Gaiellaceae bacterium]|nr:ABC-F family ATP-binding cassette domain-containing protein [Gaiellaceae bacterium]
MSVVTATNLRKELSGEPLFDGVSFKVERSDRVSLSGPNGAGKTTLLRMLNGETEVHGGVLSFAKGTRVALHDQRPPAQSSQSLREYVLSGAADLTAAEDELRRLEEAMAAGDHSDATLRRYADTQARLEHAGGYAWRERLDAVTRGLGFSTEELERPLSSFSGGELTRASLARTLSGDPDLLLLDEPTNHLDVASLEWLERELQALDAAVVLVAHDRWFLEAVTTAVLELEAGRSTYFAGPWHNWRRERAARLSAATTAAKRYDEDIARLERFVARFRYKKNLAQRAQAKLTQIGRLSKERAEVRDEISLLTRRTKSLGFGFLKPKRSGRTVVEADGVALAAGTKALLADVSFAVERGEHVALVGPNGSGKTTLLETLLGRREPAGGRLRLGHSVEPAYFSQHEVELDETRSVLAVAQRATGLTRPEAQNLLGRFLFSGWEMHERQVSALSGGERRRLALALIVASGANLLLLDEPTNHLDLESREALEAALEAFPGTVLLVSHDRALVDAVADRTLAIEDGTIRSYEGGWADYVGKREELAARTVEPEEAEPKASKARPAQPKPARPTELDRIESEIAAREAELEQLERKLADDWANVDVVAAHRRSRDELQALLARWEDLFERSQA